MKHSSYSREFAFIRGPLTQILPFPVDARPYVLHHVRSMNPPPPQPKIQLINTAEYREGYANSVQIRVNLWDFLLLFGVINQTSPDNVNIHNFQGVYLSPQQAKALLNVLQQNVSQYESAFGEIRLEPHAGASFVQ
jgi:Protein of unknown function (DUF3467)